MTFKVVSSNGRTGETDLDPIDTAVNSYAALIPFLDYWLLRNIDYSDYDAEVIQAALVKATSYMDRKYATRWRGVRIDPAQPLGWPRKSVFTNDGYAVDPVPNALRQACMEFAARTLLGADLWADPSVNRNVRKTVNQVGPIREEVEYIDGGTAPPEYPMAETLLVDLIHAAGSTSR